jgi:hypothetical protein
MTPDLQQALDKYGLTRVRADGNGAVQSGNARWRRLTELQAGTAKSIFHFDLKGSVAKSTPAGLPWLRFLCQRTADCVHFLAGLN